MSALYTIVLFVHLLGVVITFVGFGLEWISTGLLRKAETAEQANAWLRVYKASPPMTGPGLAILILSGGYLASLTHSMSQPWLLVSLFAIVIAFLQGIFVHVPKIKAIRNALAGVQGPLSSNAIAKLRDKAFYSSVRVRFFLTLGIVYLMTVKPPLTIAVMVLVFGIILGLVAASVGGSKTRTA